MTDFLLPVRFPDVTQLCAALGCKNPAEFSSVGTPTCSEKCLWLVSVTQWPEIPNEGLEAIPPPEPFRWPKPSPPPDGRMSVETALENVGTCQQVLNRHQIFLRGKTALCPFHAEKTPSMTFRNRGKSKAHCHGCGWDGDALDLEAALSGESLELTIRRWSSVVSSFPHSRQLVIREQGTREQGSKGGIRA